VPEVWQFTKLPERVPPFAKPSPVTWQFLKVPERVELTTTPNDKLPASQLMNLPDKSAVVPAGGENSEAKDLSPAEQFIKVPERVELLAPKP
jgi:hypothetical protein